MSIFDDVTGFDVPEGNGTKFYSTSNETLDHLQFKAIFCIYCGERLTNDERLLHQYCNLCRFVYASSPFLIEEMKLTKEERYKEIFNYTKGLQVVKDMSIDELGNHILMLEKALEDLLFEKRTEIQALRDELYTRTEHLSDSEKEKARSIDKRYHREKGEAEKKAIGERQERLTKREKLVKSLVSAGIDPKKAEEMASGVK